MSQHYSTTIPRVGKISGATYVENGILITIELIEGLFFIFNSEEVK